MVLFDQRSYTFSENVVFEITDQIEVYVNNKRYALDIKLLPVFLIIADPQVMVDYDIDQKLIEAMIRCNILCQSCLNISSVTDLSKKTMFNSISCRLPHDNLINYSNKFGACSSSFNRMMNKLDINFHNIDKSVFVIFSMSCNMKCSYCFEKKIKNFRSNSSNIKRSLHKLITEKTKEIVLYGGEPLLHENYNLWRYIYKSFSTKIRVITNGYNLVDFIETINDRDLGRTSFSVTIDGDKARHDSVKGLSGSFERAVAGIKKAIKKDSAVNIRVNADRNVDTNLESTFIAIFNEFEKELNSISISIARTFNFDLNRYDISLKEAYRCIRNMSDKYNYHFNCYDKILNALLNRSVVLRHGIRANSIPCIYKQEIIMPDGKICNCSEGFDQIAFEKVENLLKKCSRCIYKDICNGECFYHRSLDSQTMCSRHQEISELLEGFNHATS